MVLGSDETTAVVTTAARGAIAALHDRMPLVLTEAEYGTWLTGDPRDAARIVGEERTAELVATPVSTWVNDVRHDDPKCVEPREAVPLGQISLRF
jgi:putative SOS response-associated peptidase YedK